MLYRKTDKPVRKKKPKSLTGKIIAWLHLWPSLISALILIVVCLTGTIIVYADEIMEFSAGDSRWVEDVGAQKLEPMALINKVKEAYPERENPGYLVSYKDPRRATRINSYDPKGGLRMEYINPYTGEILKSDATIHFFFVTAHLHSQLLLKQPGFWIVGIATIIFLLELITGLVLWWPPKWNKHNRDASFKIKWKAKFKRLNYDLHNVVGFYALGICLVLTVTGLIIAFDPVQELTLKTFGTSAEAHEWEHDLEDMTTQAVTGVPYTTVEQQVFAHYPHKKEIQLYTFELSDTTAYYVMNVAKSIGLKSAEGADKIYIDRLTGKEVAAPAFVNRHNKVENAYWNLHMGKWMGQLGKFLTFLGGLISTAMPVTGFLIWWGRRKKKKPANSGKLRRREYMEMPQQQQQV